MITNRLLVLFAAVAAVFYPAGGEACRPLSVEDCPVVDKGTVALESGITSDNGDFEEVTAIKYGLAGSLDAGIDIPFLSISPGGARKTGPGDAVIKLKYNPLDYEKYPIGLSVVFAVKPPTGDAAAGLGSGTFDYTSLAVLTRAAGKGLLHANAGMAITGSSSPSYSILYGISADFPFFNEIQVVGELSGEFQAGGQNSLSALIGLYRSIKGVTLDAGITFGLVNAGAAPALTAGVSLEL